MDLGDGRRAAPGDAEPTDRAAGLVSVRPQTLANLATHLDARAVAVLRPDSEVYAEWQTVVAWLRRMAEAQPTTKPDTATLAATLDGLHTLIATSSRDWGTYRVDAWLWAVLCGWDCEQAEHDETYTHGAMEEMQQQHGWSDEAVAKARRYRAAVRALTEPAAGGRQDGAQPTPGLCPHCEHNWHGTGRCDGGSISTITGCRCTGRPS